MKKFFDYILILCLFLVISSAALVMITEIQLNSRNIFTKENRIFIENWKKSEPEDITRVDNRFSVLVLSFHQNEYPNTFGPKKAKFYFDFNNTGVAVKTGWVGPEAGLLVIDDGPGPRLLGTDGSGPTGFALLMAADANGDGRIDAADPIWNQLGVWLDANSDGLLDKGELKTLAEMKITSLKLDRVFKDKYLMDGNFIREAGIFIFGDQQAGRLDEIFLRQHNYRLKFEKNIQVPERVAAIVPDIKGAGLVRNLREAAVLNPDLERLTTHLLASKDDEERWERLDELMLVWSRTAVVGHIPLDDLVKNRYQLRDIIVSSPEGLEFAQRLMVLEAWWGRHLYLLPGELNQVQKIYDDVVIYDHKTGHVTFDFSPVVQNINNAYLSLVDNVFAQFFPNIDFKRYDPKPLAAPMTPSGADLEFAQ